MKMNKQTATIFIIMITEFLGFSLIIPILSVYAQSLGMNELTVGLFMAVFPALQFFAAPILGRVSDHVGRKPILILSQIMTGLGFVLLAIGGAPWVLFLARVVDGLFGANLTVAQAYLSDISSREDRTVTMGLVGGAMGLGGLVGPALGGYLARFGYAVPNLCAAGLSLVSILMIVFLLPETVQRNHERLELKGLLSLGAFGRYFKQRDLATSLWSYAAFMLAHALYQSMFALFANNRFGLTSAQIGLVFSVVAVVAIIMQMGLLKTLLRVMKENTLRLAGTTALALGLATMGLSPNVPVFVVGAALLAVGMGTTLPTMMGSISRKAPADEQGAVMGVASALGSLTNITAPLVGGLLMYLFFPGAPMLLGALAMVAAIILLATMPQDTAN